MTREEAILCLKGMKNYARDTFTEQTDWQTSLDMAIQALEQEPKTGHWIKDNPFLKPYCSECGKSCIGLHGFDYTVSEYCPNCGAKMIEPQERSEE